MQLANFVANGILGHLVAGSFIVRVARSRKSVYKVIGKLVQNIRICIQPSLKVSVFGSSGCTLKNLVEHRLVLEDDKVVYIGAHEFAVTAAHQILNLTC